MWTKQAEVTTVPREGLRGIAEGRRGFTTSYRVLRYDTTLSFEVPYTLVVVKLHVYLTKINKIYKCNCRISLPRLHISLNVIYHFFTLPAIGYHKLGCLLATDSQVALVSSGPSFEDHIALVKERQALTEVVKHIESEADELERLVTRLCRN